LSNVRFTFESDWKADMLEGPSRAMIGRVDPKALRHTFKEDAVA